MKSLLSKCVACIKHTGKSYDTPAMPPLPPFRVSEDVAFSQIAVDFAGPLYVRNIYGKTKETNKCYIALFTCTSTRAVHLELVPDLHAISFIRALKRFISRRGLPSLIVSDNGKTFIDCSVQNYVNSKNINWKFNVPTASWWGGVFEVLVKLTKKCLRKTLGNAHLTFEELETVLVETEGILNSRPLTFVYDEITEPPLTPSCLVTGRRLLDQTAISSRIVKSDKVTITKRSRYLESLLARFFAQWKAEYLTSLREKHKHRNKLAGRIPKLGDIVCIHKDKLPRQRWALGKIVRVLPGKDNIIRAAEVRSLDKSGNPIVLKRPVQKLYPLEITELGTEKSTLNEDVNNIPITMVSDKDVVAHIS